MVGAVVDQVRGDGAALLVRCLSAHTGRCIGPIETAPLEPVESQLLGRLHHDHDLVAAFDSSLGFHEERHVHHYDRVGRCCRHSPPELLVYRRVGDCIQGLTSFIGGERTGREFGTVQPAVGPDDIGPKSLHEFRERWLIGLHDVPSHLIGVEDDRAMGREQRGNRRLPRADTTGQPHE